MRHWPVCSQLVSDSADERECACTMVTNLAGQSTQEFLSSDLFQALVKLLSDSTARVRLAALGALRLFFIFIYLIQAKIKSTYVLGNPTYLWDGVFSTWNNNILLLYCVETKFFGEQAVSQDWKVGGPLHQDCGFSKRVFRPKVRAAHAKCTKSVVMGKTSLFII